MQAESPGTIPDSAFNAQCATAPHGGAAAAAAATGKLERLNVEVADMACASCAIVLERTAEAVPGVSRAAFHFATQRGSVLYDAGRTDVDAVLARLREAGYECWQAGEGRAEDPRRRQRRAHILRAGMAMLLAMQVMMLTLPRYLGGAEVEAELARLLDGAAWALTLPVLLYCALPFYRGARRELRVRRPGMDSAIALGLLLAATASAAQSLRGTDALYLDSISMTVALLLLARWFDWEQRQATQDALAQARRYLPPPQAERVRASGAAVASQSAERVAATDLQPGDRIRVRPGAALPVDGRLIEDVAYFDESLRNGESQPVERRAGEEVMAGAVVIGRAVEIEVLRRHADSAEQVLWIQTNAADRPEARPLTDRVARVLMSVVLMLALATFLWLGFSANVTVAIERTVALLVVTCPCALALAAPTARARATAAALRSGCLVRRADALTRLSTCTDFVFDKTGTLTAPARLKVDLLDPSCSEPQIVVMLAALERAANHPLAAAFEAEVAALGWNVEPAPPVTAASWCPGQGVEGLIGGRRWRFGVAAFAGVSTADATGDLWLAVDGVPVARVGYRDVWLDDARSLIQRLARHHRVHLFSGDHPQRVRTLVAEAAPEVAFATASGGMTAPEKAAAVAALQAAGARVAMIGDGSNDAIALACADVSIAVANATDHARGSADLLLTGEALRSLVDVVRLAAESERIVRQSLAWAIVYNATMVPAAIAGLINPAIAAVGMAASSALVTANALRVRIDPESSATRMISS